MRVRPLLLSGAMSCAILLLLVSAASSTPKPGTPLVPPPAGFQTVALDEGPENPNGEHFIQALPFPVVPGFLVLLDGNLQDSLNSHTWSDVVVFRQTPLSPSEAILVSDLPGTGNLEAGISDADLAPLGVHIGEVLTGNTVYMVEGTRSDGLNVYGPLTDPSGVATLVYNVYSDAEQQPPPHPCPGCPLQPITPPLPPFVLEEGPESDTGETNLRPLPVPVSPGYLVLLDGVLADSLNPQTWSDVVIFGFFPPGAPAAVLISDKPSGPAPEHGITDADLAPFGVTIADVINGNRCFQKEDNRADGLNIYQPNCDSALGTMIYYVYSDGEVISPVPKKTWGGIKRQYK